MTIREDAGSLRDIKGTIGWSEDPDAGELLERAWGIIANADWDNAPTGAKWRQAAINFRAAYFQWIADHATVPEPSSEVDPPTDV